MLVSTFKKKLNEIQASYPEILLFYYTFNKRCCHQVVKIKVDYIKIKPFDDEFPYRYIIHFKTVEVHFNATFGEYLILIYRYFRKIL